MIEATLELTVLFFLVVFAVGIVFLRLAVSPLLVHRVSFRAVFLVLGLVAAETTLTGLFFVLFELTLVILVWHKASFCYFVSTVWADEDERDVKYS